MNILIKLILSLLGMFVFSIFLLPLGITFLNNPFNLFNFIDSSSGIEFLFRLPFATLGACVSSSISIFECLLSIGSIFIIVISTAIALASIYFASLYLRESIDDILIANNNFVKVVSYLILWLIFFSINILFMGFTYAQIVTVISS